MARQEGYNPLLCSYPESEKVNSVSEGAEVLYVRLIAASDDAGRYYGDPKWILAKLFTARMAAEELKVSDIARRLAELEGSGLITRYAAGANVYLQLIDPFKCLRKDVKPKVLYPPPLPASVTEPERERNGYGPPEPEPEPEPEPKAAAQLAASSGVAGPTPPATSDPPSEFIFPTTGKGPQEWALPQSKLDEYLAAYPGLDVRDQLRRARQWCRDNVRNRKTAGGMMTFLTGWLNRATNRGGGKNEARRKLSDLVQ